MAVAAGKRIGRYEIRSLLGVGGMGEVYLAQDTELRRSVALKLLPSDLIGNEDRLRRFKQEAYAASALNHPNILTIYEIGSEANVHFIAAEFVEGLTLRERMVKEALNLEEVLDSGSQIASALAAAHSAGIIHRDIKPENVMVRRDGYVKVLDFGLAKLIDYKGLGSDPEAATVQVVKTDPGKVMGTANYMSPEQTRGLEVDERTDIWSLGVILYELVAGRTPFEGQTASDVLASILKNEPVPLQRCCPEAPPELQRIVRKALRKDLEERYQLVKEMGVDLKNLRRELELSAEIELSLQPPAPGARALGMSSSLGAAIQANSSSRTQEISETKPTSSAEYIINQINLHPKAVIVAVGIFGLLVLSTVLVPHRWVSSESSRGKSTAAPQNMKIARLTSTGTADKAAISPDGRYVVHAVSENGQQSLRMRQVNTSSDVQILPPSMVEYAGLTFSRDGDFIYYVGTEQNSPTSNLYKLPVLGGTPRKLSSDVGSAVTFSPDGQRLAFIRNSPNEGEDALIIANADGGDERKLIVRKLPNFFRSLSWSPDEKTIACGAGSFVPTYNTYVVEVSIENGREKQIGSQSWMFMGQVTWLANGHGMILAASEVGSGTFDAQQIWYVSYPEGEARRITNDLNNYIGVSMTGDSNRLVTVQSETISNIRLVPNGDTNRVTELTGGTAKTDARDGLAWTPEGKIVFSSKATGSLDIWTMDGDGRNLKQLTTNSRINDHPSVSTDGQYVIFASDRAGAFNVWRMDIDGGNPRQLTSGSGEENPQCTPDRKWVVYTLLGAGKPTLWRVSIDGGAPQQLTDRYTAGPSVSPDGKSIACYFREGLDTPLKLAIFPIEGGLPTRTFNTQIPGEAISRIPPLRWIDDGRALTYVLTSNGISNIWSQPVTSEQPKQVTNFKADRIFWFDWSRDGKQLIVAHGSVTSDVVLIGNFQ
jgi:serine/threonine protein kinase